MRLYARFFSVWTEEHAERLWKWLHRMRITKIQLEIQKIKNQYPKFACLLDRLQKNVYNKKRVFQMHSETKK